MSNYLFIISIALLAVGGSANGREWSEPIELTDVRWQRLDNDFDVALDNNGNIHLLYQVMEYYGNDSSANRILYSVYSSTGDNIRTFTPFGEGRASGTGTL